MGQMKGRSFTPRPGKRGARHFNRKGPGRTNLSRAGLSQQKPDRGRRLLPALLLGLLWLGWETPALAVEVTGEVAEGSRQQDAGADGNGTPLTVTGFPTARVPITGSFTGTVNLQIEQRNAQANGHAAP